MEMQQRRRWQNLCRIALLLEPLDTALEKLVELLLLLQGTLQDGHKQPLLARNRSPQEQYPMLAQPVLE
jgi:hypothetical protein